VKQIQHIPAVVSLIPAVVFLQQGKHNQIRSAVPRLQQHNPYLK